MAHVYINEQVLTPHAYFEDRADAGRQLAEIMDLEPRDDALVLGLARGGLPVAAPIAAALGVRPRAVIACKLPLPSSPEMGFGAICADGSLEINDRVVKMFNLREEEVQSIAEKAQKEAQRRAREYAGTQAPPDAEGKAVYIADDGLATGYTAIAAAKMIRKLLPASITMCAPVSPVDSIQTIEPHFDAIYCGYAQKAGPFAVASFYTDFHDLPDEEARAARRSAGR